MHYLFRALILIALPAILQAQSPSPLMDVGDTARVQVPVDGKGWTLSQCIQYALTHNIQIQQTQLNVDLANINLQQSRAAVLPNLNATGSHTYQFGRTVDRFTNTFADGSVLSQNFFLSSNLTLFAGGQNYNTIKQNEYAVQSNALQIEQTRNDISLNVATAYLNVLFAQEQLAVAEQQVLLTKSQSERMQKMVDAGASARGALLDLQSQFAQEELTRVNAQNNVTMSYLTLTQLMNLDSTTGFSIVKPDLGIPAESIAATSATQIYQTAIATMPLIKKAEMDLRGSEKGLAIAYGALSPRLSVQGSLGTGFSGLAKDVTGTTIVGADTTFTAGGDFILRPRLNFETETTPFRQQIENNFNRTIGFQLTVPIFNNLQTSASIKRAKIQRENARLNVELQEQQLRRNIDQAWADAQAALQRYRSSEQAVRAAQEAFRYAEDRFNNGASNAIDYGTAKNRLTQAQANLLQARFDYLLKLKVLDFYQGKPLTF